MNVANFKINIVFLDVLINSYTKKGSFSPCFSQFFDIQEHNPDIK